MKRMNPECRTISKGPYKMDFLDKVMYYGGAIVLVSTFLLFILGAYLYFIDANPALVFIGKPVAYMENGDVLAINLSYCKYTDMPSKMTHCFIDGLVFCTPEQSGGIFKRGCYYNQTFRMTVPKSLPNGVYTVQATRTYQVNPFATRVVVEESTAFVLNRSDKDC